MRFLPLLTLAVAGTVFAQDGSDFFSDDSDDALAQTGHRNHTTTPNGGNGNKNHESTEFKCLEIHDLTKLVNLANNATRLNRTTHGDATKAAAIKAEASKAASTLAGLKSNSTLVASCDKIFAHEEMVEQCARMHSFERLEALAANATRLDNKFHGDAAKISAVKAEATADASKLSKLSGNATLTQFCAARRDHQRCLTLERLQKEVDRAANATHAGGAHKTGKAHAEASSSAAAKLNQLKSNTTLVNYCNSQSKSGSNGSSTGGSSSSQTSSSSSPGATSSTSSSSTTNSGPSLIPWGMELMTSLVALVLFGVCLL